MKKKILIIEDEPSIADNLRYALKTEGFETASAETAQKGLSLLKDGGIDLIILDVGLPDGNGFEICRELRKKSSTPVIFLTARDEEVDRVVGLEIGADDYIIKPFSPRELTARVRAVLRRYSDKVPVVDPTSPSNSTPFLVDEERHIISFRGKPLHLSRYEFGILKVLIARPGRVFSRDELMDRVWEAPESSLDRTVDAHIKSIRAELKKADPKEEPIQTHRGLGYSLRENL